MRLRRVVTGVFVLSFAVGLLGQEYRGSIAGRVVDPTGAVVPSANVTLTNTATNVRQTAQSNASGDYTLPYIQPGSYKVTVESQGFKTFERSPIEVRINQRVRVDVELELGNTAETITVQAETPLLDTGSASVGQTIESRRLVELPVQQGVLWHMIALSAGVAKTGTNMQDENPYDGTPTWYSVQGASDTANLMTIDGAATGRGQPSFTPPQEAVGEMRVLTSNFDAAQGFTQGANVSVSLKSGSNALHGSAAWYGGGNGNLTASNYFNVKRGLPKSPSGPYFRRNASVGGPVYLPKVYDGRNKTFFFWSYEGIHRTQVNTTDVDVPRASWRGGDFSDLLGLGPEYQLYDPYSWQVAANGRLTSSPLPGNKIPQSQIDSIAAGLMKIWPLPNQPGRFDGRGNFFCDNSGQANQYWGTTIRVDHNFSERHRVFGSYYRSSRVNQDYNIFKNDVSGDSWISNPKGGVVDYVYVMSPTFIMDARMGVDRTHLIVAALGPAVLNFRYADWGWPAAMDKLVDPSILRMPSISAAGITGAPPGANLSLSIMNTFTPSVHFTKTLSNHTMNFGWEQITRQRIGYAPGIGASGNYWFGGNYVFGPFDNSAGAPNGAGLSQMLYGLPTSSSINRVPSYAAISHTHGFYFQEDWRVTPKLTLNLGARYEYWGGPSERFDRTIRGFDANASLPIAGAVAAAYAKNPIAEVSALSVKGGLTFAGVNGQPHALAGANHDIMPRIGMSYALNNKTVIHTGYGMFFGAGGIEYQNVRQTGFSRTTTTNASNDNGLTYTNRLSNPFPDGVLEPLGAGLGAMTSVGSSITFLNTEPQGLYAQRWQFNVQRELPWRMVVSAGYSGSRQVHLSTTKNLNALPRQYLSKSPVRDQATINYLTTNVPNPFYGYAPGTSLGSNKNIQRSQLLVPFPQFSGVNVDTQQGYGWYHGLLLTAEKRMSSGFTLQASYTWSKAMSADSFLNGADPVPTEMISSLDRTHYLSLSSIYELPVGRGRLVGGDMSRLADFFVGGWQLAGVYRFQSGQPLGFSNPLFNGSCSGWKDVTLPAGERDYNRWFNTSCFDRTNSHQLSSNVVTVPTRFSWLRTDALSVTDFSLIKRFRFTERVSLEAKGELQNAFNRPWLSNPNMTPTSGSFGSIGWEGSYPRRFYWSGRLSF